MNDLPSSPPPASHEFDLRTASAPAAAVVAPAPPVTYRPPYWFLAVVAVISLAADLVTKTWAERHLQMGSGISEIPTPKTIIPKFFGFVLAKNKGGAWGLLQNEAENIRKPFFVTVSVLAILFIVSLYRRLHPSQWTLRWGLPLVLGGALGNLVDRIRYGYVIDFIDVQASWGGASHHWPTFNVADIAICIGVMLMAADMLTPKRAAVVIPPGTHVEGVPSPSASFPAPTTDATEEGLASNPPPISHVVERSEHEQAPASSTPPPFSTPEHSGPVGEKFPS